MNDINWDRLRTWQGSQQKAFEKLCCQLAMCDPPEVNAEFIVKGDPDAGVECYWQLHSGEESGWQAKFFTGGKPTSSQWQKITNSFKKALDKHPHLTKYTICIPQDRADPRKPEAEHFMDKWKAQVEAWQQLAAARGREVKFEYWGTSEVFELLAQDRHRGRYFFWFNKEYLTTDWFADRLEEQRADEPRYTPEVSVDLPIVQQFEAFSRTEFFTNQVHELLGKLRRAWEGVAGYMGRLEVLGEAEPLRKAGEALAEEIRQFSITPTGKLPFPTLLDKTSTVFYACRRCEDAIYEIRKKQGAQDNQRTPETNRYLDTELYCLGTLASETYSIMRFCDSLQVTCAANQAVLLRGNAGVGKTHVLFDVALSRINRKLPTVFLLGKKFYEHELWTQIAEMLHIQCSRDELLGALEAAGQASGHRVMIIVDALNEGPGRKLWRDRLGSFLKAVKRYSWISVILSVRTTYEEYVIPSNIGDDHLLRIDHIGFEGMEYEAAGEFFRYYGIESPTVPLLHPEFANPLFLKLLCEGLQKASLTRVPKGFRGISQLFQFLIDSANERLAEKLDYALEKNLVEQALGALAAKMLANEGRWLSFDDAEEVCESILSRQRDSNGLCRNLIHEGLLRKECSWLRKDSVEEGVMFAYERLADHLVVSQMLEEHVEPEDPRAAFAPDQPLGALAESEQACWGHRGLIEAMSIQLPEHFGLEFAELFPDRADDDPVVDAFLNSVAWRSPKAFSKATRDMVNTHVLKCKERLYEFLRILLRVSPDPEHPYNAGFLHNHLMKCEMAHRDGWWSMFLHDEGPEHSVVSRLIDWAWTYKGKLDNDSRVLYGTVLAWFLTSSNRYIRDRATKAIVNLFTHHLETLQLVIERFIDVDDPYVLERVFAAAYGATIRTRDPESARNLALKTYEWVFRAGTPPVHILTRDYARGVIEFALYLDNSLAERIDLVKIRPPYTSEWDKDLPSSDELRNHPALHSEDDRRDFAGRRIAFSVLEWDFGRYIIGTNSGYFRWSSRHLHGPRQPSLKEQIEAFETSLTSRQAKAWASYKSAYDNVTLARLLDPEESAEEFVDSKIATLEDELAEIRKQFLRTMRGKKRQLFENVVDPYLSGPTQDEFAFDLNLAQRWILNRVIELGWTAGLLGEVDAQLIDEKRWRSVSTPAERIGKKYQWIAYHEFLARVSDNFEFRTDTINDLPGRYDGPWQLGNVRDVDPSIILRETRRGGWASDPNNWWFRKEYTNWGKGRDWLSNSSDLDGMDSLLEVTNPSDEKRWLVLEGSYSWEEPTPPGEERYENQRCQLWIHTHGYLVRKSELEKLRDWARGQDFHGDWMPRPADLYQIFLGEFHWSPAYRFFATDNYYREGWTQEGRFTRLPVPLLPIAEGYNQEATDSDRSITEGIYLRLPCKEVAALFDLHWAGFGAHFCDESGTLISHDPSALEPGPSVLLFRKDRFIDVLERSKLAVFWVVVGEKHMVGESSDPTRDYEGRLVISGFAVLGDDKIALELNPVFHPPPETI